MTFETGWALIGLVALVPLVALHLRDRSRQERDVSSLVLWRELEAPRPTGNRGRRSPRQPLLLLLQALVLVLFVLALAQPHGSAGAAPPGQIAILDDSLQMSVPGRLAAAEAALERAIATAPAGERVSIVLDQGSPRVLYRGRRDGVAAALRAVKPTLAPSSLAAAFTAAAGLAAGAGDTITVIVARGDPLPRVVGAARGQLHTVTIGSPTDDQGIFGATARCGIGTPATCEIDATVENLGNRPALDRLTAAAAGRPPLRFAVRVPAGGTAPIVLGAVAGERVTLQLDRPDAVIGDDSAWVAVPAAGGLPAQSVVTLVGLPGQALPVARAFAAVPGVQLRLLTPARYRPVDARSSDLVVLDDWLPKGALPPSPSVLLVDPPRIPGGRVRGSLTDPVLTGADSASPLLSGVNLSSLVIDPGGARGLTLPAWVTPVAWSAGGPLLAAGDDGRTRLAILGFEPGRSDLPQLAAFPLLAGNLVAWAGAWAPETATAGEPLSVDATAGARSVTFARGHTVLSRVSLAGRPVALAGPSPGLYTITETGPGVTRHATVTVDDVLAAPAGGPVDLSGVRTAALEPPAQWSRWFLLATLVVLGGEWLYWLSTRPRPLGRERAAWVLTALALVFIVLGLAELRIDSGPRGSAVLAVDGSASIDPHEAQQERSIVARFAASDCETPCRIVRFAGSASASAVTGGHADDRVATDLEDGVSAALGTARRGGRVVVLSDGAQTTGDLIADEPLARARQVRVSWIRLRSGAARDAAVTSLELPAAVHLGDSVPIALTVHSTTTGFALLQVRSDGSPTRSQTIRILAGDNPLLLLYTAARRGWHGFQASVSLNGDTDPHDNALSAVTDVLAAPRVLAVTQPGSEVSGLLAQLGMRVRSVAADRLPTTAAGYLDVDAVVLDDVPATALSRARAVALDDAVSGGGLGLLALGGPHSFSLGRYATSSLQSILPVRSLVPGNLQRRNVAIELVLDHSGSMIDRAGGVPKITMTHQAARQAAGFIAAHDDQLGIIDFDIVPHTLVALERLDSSATRNRVDRTVDGLQADGGTNIYLGLQAGYRQLLRSHAQERHMILMTDGISQPENYGPLLAEIRQAHISVATVALGSDADRALLAQIASATGGHAYATDNAHELPTIFAKETQLSAKPVRVRGRLAVSLSADSPVVRSLLGGVLPAVSGNVVSTVKSGAQADLVASGAKSTSDPALAEWQIGAGRVVAWTPGLGTPWGTAWLRRPSLWDDAIRWLERGVQVPPLTPIAAPGSSGELEIDLAPAGPAALGVTGVAGTLTDTAGRRTAVRFSAAGPAIYTASVAGLAPGVYAFSLATSGVAGLRSSGEVAIPYPAEFSPASLDASPLDELVHQTGGRVTDVADLAPVLGGVHSFTQALTLAALVCFVAGVLLRLLPGRRGRRPAELIARRRRSRASRSGRSRAADPAARR